MSREVELKVLSKLAAEYRQRALTEPEMATTLLEIAEEMEASAQKLSDA